MISQPAEVGKISENLPFFCWQVHTRQVRESGQTSQEVSRVKRNENLPVEVWKVSENILESRSGKS